MKNLDKVPIIERLVFAYHKPFAAAEISPRMVAISCRSQRYPFILRTVGVGVEWHFIEHEFLRQIRAFISGQSGSRLESWEVVQPGLKLQVTAGVWQFKTGSGDGGFHELTDRQVTDIKAFFGLE
ncbi:MAG: hypothetical protein AAGF88_08815 [Pseudomonadota bacterium]